PLDQCGLFWFIYRPRLPGAAERGLRVERREFAVAIFLQEPHAMAAAEEILDLLGHFSQSRLRFEHPGQFRRVFALPHRHAVSVLLPRRANVVAMAEQAFVAVDEFRDRLADVIAAPGFRINGFLLRLVLRLILTVRAAVERESEERERADYQRLCHLGAQSLGAQSLGAQDSLPACFHKVSISFQLSAPAIRQAGMPALPGDYDFGLLAANLNTLFSGLH